LERGVKSAIEQPSDEFNRFWGALGAGTANGDGGHYPDYDRGGFGDVGARVERSFGYRTDPTDDDESTQGEKESEIATAGDQGIDRDGILPLRETVGAMKPLIWTALGRATRETAATAERARYKRSSRQRSSVSGRLGVENSRDQSLTETRDSWLSILDGWSWLNWVLRGDGGIEGFGEKS
jgi:hypothetical protein